MWYYSWKDHEILSKVHPGKAVFEGFNRNLVLWKDKNLKNQKFKLDPNSLLPYNEYTKNGFKVLEYKEGASVKTGKVDHKKIPTDMQWKFIQC